MPILFPGGDSAEAIVAFARKLAEDFERLTADGSPSRSDLATAPVIDLWRPAPRILLALAGTVTGHPILRDGRPTITSQLFAYDEAAGWARTWSRYYALGRRREAPTEPWL